MAGFGGGRWFKVQWWLAVREINNRKRNIERQKEWSSTKMVDEEARIQEEKNDDKKEMW